MKRISFAIIAVTSITIYVVTSCNNVSSNSATIAQSQKVDSAVELINRGKYLVTTIGCDDCHSPKKLGPNGPEVIEDLRFSGYPANRPVNKISTDAFSKGWMTFNQDLTSAAGPWGISFSANITSDSTGIGAWKEEQFIKAIRAGKSKGLEANRPLLPPMPWWNFRNLSDTDLRAIYAFLKTTKPVHNVVPQPVPPQQ
jgi:hypothetical protein